MLCVWHAFWDCCLAGAACLLECHIQLCSDFFSLYVIIPACVVMLHMGCPIGALFVQAHNWTAVIWLPASAKATTFCPYSPAAADVCAVCTILFVRMCVFMFVRCIYIWKSFDVIIHAESQENWPSSVGLVALPQGWIVHIYTHVYKDGHLWVSASKSMRYQFTSFHHVLSINICPQQDKHIHTTYPVKPISPSTNVLFLGMQGSV